METIINKEEMKDHEEDNFSKKMETQLSNHHYLIQKMKILYMLI
jgi:hypothetical protein